MKKRIITLLIASVLLICSISAFAIVTSASSPAPELNIAYCNLSFRDSVCIKYAVSSNVSDVKILIWTSPEAEYTVGTHDDEITEYYTEDINGTSHMIFDYTALSAKQMTDVVYARAYSQSDGVDYYSDVNKYSILQYAYNKLGKTATESSDTELKEMLTHMLAYGAAAQKYLDDYKVDRLATADWYQVKVTAGVLDDGSTHGLYLPGDKVTITEPATDTEGTPFAYWKDSSENEIATSATYELTVGNANEVYMPVYVKYSSGLEFDSNGDGTCYVIGMGDCTDTELVIPPVSPHNDTVIGIDSSAFAGEAITSVSFPSTIEDIARRAFNNCTSLTDVYYDGTEEEWNTNISIAANNDPILNATMHFNEPAVETFTVTFVDYDGTVLKTETVESGKSATAPADPTREGYEFTSWSGTYTNVTADQVVTATYTQNAPTATYTVTFYDYDGTTVLGTSNVAEGKAATPPANPSKSGATFLGWNGNYANVTKKENFVAVYDDSKNIFTVESATGSVGDTVTLLVSVDGTVKTCGFDITIYYDNAILELVSYDSDLDLDVVVNPEYLDNGVLLNFSAATEKTKSREIIALTFRIKDTTADATNVYVEKTSVKEMDGSTIIDSTCEFVDGVVTIQ